MSGEGGGGVGERVGVEGGAAGGEPHRLDEASGAVDPAGGDDPALGCEELCQPGKRRVEAGVAGWCRLGAEQGELAGA
jgi:hypothetical protein